MTLDSLWDDADLPLLREIAERFTADGEHIRIEALEEELGRSEHELQVVLRRLKSAGYIEAVGIPELPVIEITSVSEKGLQAVGAYPGGSQALATALVKSLEEAAEQEPNPEQASKLRRAASTLRGVATEVLSKVLAEVVAKSSGLG